MYFSDLKTYAASQCTAPMYPHSLIGEWRLILLRKFSCRGKQMKKQMLLGSSLVASALMTIHPAPAADMAVKAPPAAPAIASPFSWTGPYVGIVGGYGWGHSDQWNSCGTDCEGGDGSFKMTGGLVGGTVGQNWQWGAWVVGIESDASWADISGSSNACGPNACGTKLDFLGTLRGRVGVPMGPNGGWLPYVTGGYAYGQVKAWNSFFPGNSSDYRSGWTVGGGIEAFLAPNWTFKVEYLWVDLGNQVMFPAVNTVNVPEWASVRDNVIRVGIDYHSR
jgi:outer membrane immunogenic protein